ncbi:MAG: GC-type dockerin domain-anchored protein [Phycisphaerales bacterium]
MNIDKRVAVVALVAASVSGAALGQVTLLIADDNADRIMIARDVNGDGVIDASDPLELHAFFEAPNASGLPGPANPNALGYWHGLALIGDTNSGTGRRWTWARDLNGDGDALDVGESGVFADATNAAGFSFAAPSGVAFGPSGRIALVNSGNGFGADDVFIAADGNADGDVNSAGELTRFVTINGFGTNGGFSPQEITFTNDGSLYLRNSSTNASANAAQGIYRLKDVDGNGVIDSATEMTLFFGPGNESGITTSAGFSLNVDPVRPRAFYMWQLATGSNDQLLRVQDLNGDGDAMDAGEATVVYSTAEAGFTSVDALPLADGSVLISDNSGNRVFRLVDLNGDGLFTGENERQLFVGSGLSASRTLALVHDVGCNGADLGRQGGLTGGDGQLDNNDFIAFINLFFVQAPLADVGSQGGFTPGDGQFDNNDFIVFINLFFSGC